MFKIAVGVLSVTILILLNNIGAKLSNQDPAIAAERSKQVETRQETVRKLEQFCQTWDKTLKHHLHSVTKIERGWLYTEATIPYSVWQNMGPESRKWTYAAINCQNLQHPIKVVSANGTEILGIGIWP